MSNSEESRFADLKRQYQKMMDWMRDHIPPGLRLVVGLVLIVAGIFGFLPVLGFWMVPLGFGVAALDVKPLWQYLRRKIR